MNAHAQNNHLTFGVNKKRVGNVGHEVHGTAGDKGKKRNTLVAGLLIRFIS